MCDVISLSFVTGYFWHVDSLHLDVNYTIEGDRHKCEQNFMVFPLKTKKCILKTFFSFPTVVCWSPSPSSDRRRHRNGGGFSQYGGSHMHHRGGHNGMVGDPLCDSPQTLVDSALRFMRDRSGWDGADFIVWTG